MTTMMYCAILFQTIVYWDAPKIEWHSKESIEWAISSVHDRNYVSCTYGFEVQTWAMSLKECEPIPAKDLYKELTYLVEMKDNSLVCRETY